MTDESTVLATDDSGPFLTGTGAAAAPSGLIVPVLESAAESIVDKLRADLRPKREWRVTKARLEADVARLERLSERLAERVEIQFKRAEFNGRAALIGWCTAAGMLVLVAAKW